MNYTLTLQGSIKMKAQFPYIDIPENLREFMGEPDLERGCIASMEWKMK